jgi:hypothetical protein
VTGVQTCALPIFSFRALQPLVPPILVGVEGGCWHLRFDFFRNGWLVQQAEESVPVPRVYDLQPDDEPSRADLFEALGALTLPAVAQPVIVPWWTAARSRRVVEVLWADD